MVSIFDLGVLVMAPVFLSLSIISGRVAWRERRISALWPPAVALAALVLLAGMAILDFRVAVHYWDGWELSPEPTAQELVGSYRRGDASLTLGADGTFVGPAARGRWKVESSVLSLGPDRWAILKRDGELVLLSEPGDWDPDGWNKHRVWSRSPAR